MIVRPDRSYDGGRRVRESEQMTTTLHDVIELARREQYLAVVSTSRADSTIQSSLVNVGAVLHPITGDEVLAFVTYGRVKLGNLRARPAMAVTVRVGWEWATVEGRAELVGPDDLLDGLDADGLRHLLREVFIAAGGSHDDWDEYDAAMLREGRTVVFVAPSRIYSN
jgi:PPOX class probable F420-dependent enzyme